MAAVTLPTKTVLVPLEGPDGLRADIGVEVSTLCLGCARFRATGWPSCEAFPDAIPNPIRLGEFDHRNPYPGDGGIQYEPKEREA